MTHLYIVCVLQQRKSSTINMFQDSTENPEYFIGVCLGVMWWHSIKETLTFNLRLGYGLLPDRHQGIIWTNAGVFFLFSNEPLWTNFSEILIKAWHFLFTKMRSKMSANCWPFCPRLNLLKDAFRCSVWFEDHVWTPTDAPSPCSSMFRQLFFTPFGIISVLDSCINVLSRKNLILNSGTQYDDGLVTLHGIIEMCQHWHR